MIIALQTLIFFRESIIGVIDRLLRPYYKHFSITFNRLGSNSDDEESGEHVFAEYDDEKGVVFFPPMYVQRYAAVSDCLVDERWVGKLEKVVDFGYHDLSFIKYLKDIPGIKTILGVDLDTIPLRCSSDLLGADDSNRDSPLQITLFQGNAADPDYRLIGCDAVVAIEMIEHMLPHDLDRFVHTIFGFIKPWGAIITTPNGDFNPLFKKLENNGLRRLDHFFEWSREQFHDWCSNIVARYPQYTVSCRGIGPGPPGTLQYGCCSQLALFVSKDYQKQQDLNLNSLAVVAKPPKSTNVCDIIENINNTVSLNDSMLYSPNDTDSYTELVYSEKQSFITIVLTPTFSLESLEYHDKVAQCNLDVELGKKFLMFDEEQYCDVLVPRRKLNNRVYLMESVNNRLNCTTLQVKKFSKTTQNMLVKNKEESITNTRDVVNEIEHLTRMLNLSNYMKEKVDTTNGHHLWYNINWGDNAPYWNQYYKTVKEYVYPLQVESEESRIINLVSDEINRMIDMQTHEDLSANVSEIEIPVDSLMKVVQHITGDVERVKDLLEWNGYEIVNDAVKYTRQMDDVLDDGWRDDAFSDWDTDLHSASFTDESTVMPEFVHSGRYLHCALDGKVRKLRSLLTVDEDIAVELDRVVCRLMKLALRATKHRQSPLPRKWLQCKMLDLLTLTERAVERKKKHFIESYPLDSICYFEDCKTQEINLREIKEDNIANEIVQKYHHLVDGPVEHVPDDVDYLYGDDLSLKSSKEILKQTESHELNSPPLVDFELVPKNHALDRNSKCDTSLLRTQVWVNKDVDLVKYTELSIHGISSGDTDNVSHISKKTFRKHKIPTDEKHVHPDVKKRKKSNIAIDVMNKNDDKNKNKDISKTRLIKKAVNKKLSYNVLIKNCYKKISPVKLENLDGSSLHVLQGSVSKPIPNNFRREKLVENSPEELICKEDKNRDVNSISEFNLPSDIANTEKSLLVSIVTEEREETIALRRTIATDAMDELDLFEQETILGSLTNVMNADSYHNNNFIDNVPSPTMFVYDINEPSTSKGVRHVNTDVQCGPDEPTNLMVLAETTSFTHLSKICNTGIGIGSPPDIQAIEHKSADFGTTTSEWPNETTANIKTKSIGIIIKDSDTAIKKQVEIGTTTVEVSQNRENADLLEVLSMPNNFNSQTETHLLKPITSKLSGSDFFENQTHVESFDKDLNDLHNKSSLRKDVGVEQQLLSKYVRPKLSCGGVHVHSYKDRQTSEDVVYQGGWQRHRPKGIFRKRVYNTTVTPTRIKERCTKNTRAISKANPLDNNIMFSCEKARDKNFKKIKDKELIVKSTSNIVATKIIRQNKNATKVATKLLPSSVLPKPNKVYVTKKPSTSLCTRNVTENPAKCCKKSYLPVYLKRKLAKNRNDPIVQTNTKVVECTKKDTIVKRHDFLATKDKDKECLLKSLDFNFKPKENLSYVVFHNEIRNSVIPEADSDTCIGYSSGRSPSPQSQNSSAYSSPNSIATVRIRPTSTTVNDRRISTSSNNSNTSQCEITQVKTKKFAKRGKNIKKLQGKDLGNKENFPKSSESGSQSEKNKENAFLMNKNIFRAHVKECSPQSSAKISIRNPTTACSDAKQNTTSKPKITKRISHKSRSSLLSKNNNVKNPIYIETPTVSFQDEDPQTLQPDTNENMVNIVENCLLSEWMNSKNKTIVDSHSSNILAAMKHLVEESLDFIDDSSDYLVDTKTVVLSRDKFESVSVSASTSFHDISSLDDSFATGVEGEDIVQEDDMKVEKKVTDALDLILGNKSLTSSSGQGLTDVDLLKSLTSAPKLSEYFLAESSYSEITDSHYSGPDVPISGSVQDIFERKKQLSVQNLAGPLGALALQAFSGFSMNAEPIAGDRLDRINVDFDTGSFELNCNRQTISEEVFVSGRSSDSYESCLIEDDAVVPYWLFEIISQQQSLDDDEEPLPLSMPSGDPMIDVNGNAIEPEMGVGAGAGDGRGIHSDHSRDSSGHGTLSSSTISSGPYSEDVLIDAPASPAQFDLTREPISTSQLRRSFQSPETSINVEEGRTRDAMDSSGERPRPSDSLRPTSDVDADVSSIDTDVLDSSDY